jgi:hypothetical protein
MLSPKNSKIGSTVAKEAKDPLKVLNKSWFKKARSVSPIGNTSQWHLRLIS